MVLILLDSGIQYNIRIYFNNFNGGDYFILHQFFISYEDISFVLRYHISSSTSSISYYHYAGVLIQTFWKALSD